MDQPDSQHKWLVMAYGWMFTVGELRQGLDAARYRSNPAHELHVREQFSAALTARALPGTVPLPGERSDLGRAREFYKPGVGRR